MALRWGICSAGKISHDFVVGVKALPETEHKVVAVAARSVESSSKFAQTHSIPRHYGTYEELAKDSEVDVVYVGNIHVQHLPSVMMMFEAGKHVLCEKPLTVTSQDTATLIKAAKEKGVFFMEAVWMRFFPAVVELRRQIAEGAIGDVKHVYVNFGFRRDKPDQRLIDPKMGGGAALDIGIYVTNFATMIFGEKPESVHATGWLTSTEVDEFAAITLKYSGERVAQLTCSTNLALPNEAMVVGTKGILKVHARFWCPTKLETPKGELEFPLPDPYLPTNYANSVGLCYEAEEVKSCLEKGKKESDVMPLSHTQITADILEDVMRQLGHVNYRK